MLNPFKTGDKIRLKISLEQALKRDPCADLAHLKINTTYIVNSSHKESNYIRINGCLLYWEIFEFVPEKSAGFVIED